MIHRLITLPTITSMANFSMATLCSGVFINLYWLFSFVRSHRSHGNTLWLDTIEERVKLKDVDVITPVRSLRGQLLQLGLAEINTRHLAQLKQATSDVSSTTSIIEPR